MKLERERDIPAFKGKTWRERIALRDRAKERDHSIIWVRILVSLLTFAPISAVIFFVLSYPAFTFLYALFITPRIRRALESDAKPSA
jgi:hypothetical protein